MADDKSTKNQSTPTPKPERKKKEGKRTASPKPYCGIIMPISAIDGCPEAHWGDVREIIEAATADAGFEPRLVSDADEVGIIQKRIIQNIYDDPIVVCDVSGKNPNVMFELGMRLAFDKPTIIIKDDKTTYTFDTAPIEHLEYPRDLRFARVVEFQQSLSAKVKATHTKAQTDKNYTTFLKSFGSFSIAKLESRTVDRDEFILEELRGLKSLVLKQRARTVEDRSGEQRMFIAQAVRRALDRVRPGKSRKQMYQQVLSDILGHERPDRIFERADEFEEAVATELARLGFKP